MNPARNRILVACFDGLYLAHRLLRILHDADLDIDLLCGRDDPIQHSRYVKNCYLEDTFDSVSERLIELFENRRADWRAIIVANEPLTRRLISSGASGLLEWQPGLADPICRDFMLSKRGLVAAREQWDLKIPPSRTVTSDEEVTKLASECGWPLIVKPLDDSGGAGVMRLDDPGAVYRSLNPASYPLIAQKFIQGNRGAVDMVCARGRPLAWLTSYSIARRGGDFGASTGRKFVQIPALTPIVESVALHTRFEGFCGFDWMEEASTGEYYLIEFHPRAPSGFRFGRFCGVSFSEAVRSWLEGRTVDHPLVQAPGQAVVARYFTPDLLRCLRERDWNGLREWLPGSGSRHDIYIDDWPVLLSLITRGKKRNKSW